MMIVADNLHVMRPAIARALETLDPSPLEAELAVCLQRGAQALDLNPGPLRKAPEARMTFLVETVQARTDLPLLLDTTNPAALAAGLNACRGQAIINGVSLEPAKLERILPLAVAFDADLIGYLLHSDSRVPMATGEMAALAVELFQAVTEAGLDPRRLIVDPVIVPLSWQDGARHNRAVLEVIGMLPELLGVPVRTIAGISNLASGDMPTARKIALEQAFVPMLAAAGLSMALVNVSHAATLETIRICNTLLNEGVFGWAEPAPETQKGKTNGD